MQILYTIAMYQDILQIRLYPLYKVFSLINSKNHTAMPVSSLCDIVYNRTLVIDSCSWGASALADWRPSCRIRWSADLPPGQPSTCSPVRSNTCSVSRCFLITVLSKWFMWVVRFPAIKIDFKNRCEFRSRGFVNHVSCSVPYVHVIWLIFVMFRGFFSNLVNLFNIFIYVF